MRQSPPRGRHLDNLGLFGQRNPNEPGMRADRASQRIGQVINERQQTAQQSQPDQQAGKPELKPRERVVKAIRQGEDDHGYDHGPEHRPAGGRGEQISERQGAKQNLFRGREHDCDKVGKKQFQQHACIGLRSGRRRPARAAGGEHEHEPEQADAERHSGANRKTAKCLPPMLKIKKKVTGGGLTPDQRHEQIGAQLNYEVVDDLADPAGRHQADRYADGLDNRLRAKRCEENAGDKAEQVNDPHDFTQNRRAGRRSVVTDLSIARKQAASARRPLSLCSRKILELTGIPRMDIGMACTIADGCKHRLACRVFPHKDHAQ